MWHLFVVYTPFFQPDQALQNSFWYGYLAQVFDQQTYTEPQRICGSCAALFTKHGAILSGTSAHSLGKFVQTKGAEGSSENVGSARAIVYTGHFIRAGFFFLVQVPILPVLGLPIQKARARVKVWFGTDEIRCGKVVYSVKFIRAEPNFLARVPY